MIHFLVGEMKWGGLRAHSTNLEPARTPDTKPVLPVFVGAPSNLLGLNLVVPEIDALHAIYTRMEALGFNQGSMVVGHSPTFG